jgi:hypothetical protein
LLNDLPDGVRKEAWDSSKGGAERKAARALGTLAGPIGPASYLLWGRSLTQERDARLSDGETRGSSRSMQARRGHVTRQLIIELRDFLEDRGLLKHAGEAS